MLAETSPYPQPAEVGSTRSTRILGYIVAVLLGLLFGILGTVVHQISFSLFGLFDVPIGLVLALAATAMLLVGLRLVVPSRLAAVFASVALVGIVSLFSLPSTGGSTLIAATPVGMVWVLGVTLVAVVVLAWPKPAPQKK
ncbi:DUF6113 family protein [Herbiconiux liukaitaii]|uniref:DUF6113 family protein n=1 Tax=Herbiconiux liukaitaii TaxID=3342799 RepID=UPI0035B93663